MSYGSNLLTNPSAEDGLTGWITSNVTVPNGYFLLGATAYMYQVVSAAIIGAFPDIDFKVTVDFKLTTAQELYDNDVKGWVNVEILYSDNSKSKFRVPCVLGVDMEGRNLEGGWLRAEAECTVKSNLDITSVTVRIETSALTDGLQVDQVKLEKNLETIIGTLIDGNKVVSVNEGSNLGKPIFTFTIKEELEEDSKPCVPLPVPYDCTIEEIYAYVDMVGDNSGYPGYNVAIKIDILVNNESIFPSSQYLLEILKNEHIGEITPDMYPYWKITELKKNDVIYPSITQVGNITPGADLCIEVRCAPYGS